jgi:hypothetical protein
MTIGVLAAIDVIDGSNLNAEEKRHLRRLVGGLNLSPDLFEGTPNFGQFSATSQLLHQPFNSQLLHQRFN